MYCVQKKYKINVLANNMKLWISLSGAPEVIEIREILNPSTLRL
jgi:hypothetical protein